MSKLFVAPHLSAALTKFKEIVYAHSEKCGKEGKRLVVFCEDRLSLIAERAVCEATGGTFAVSVYTLSRFLTLETGGCADVLTSQGSAMAIRKLIEDNRENLQLFKRLSAAGAAQEVYDTIALLFSSKVSYDDLDGVETDSMLLKRKLHDLQFLYREYTHYLSERGAVDRNAYLRRLPTVIESSEKIRGADVLFLGFQAFTSSVADCVRACMQTADDVYGVLVGGSEKKYVNEAWTSFLHLAVETGRCNKGDRSYIEKIPSPFVGAAETLRRYVFEPESFHKHVNCAISRGQLNIIEAADEEEECYFIASQILKCVKEDGVRYREISVMLPDLNAVQPIVERAFGEYGIPMYADRTYPLLSHSACPFILDYLTCAADGCRKESVLAVVGSPLFYGGMAGGDKRSDRDIFVNYLLRAATFRGGVKKAAKESVCNERGLNFDAVERVRNAFMEGLKLLPAREADGRKFCAAVRKLLTKFSAAERLKEMAESAEADGFNSVAAMSSRVYGEILKVLDEAEKLVADEKITAREFIKILKSGFNAAEIALIQPKQDAVFVSDLSATANAGSKVLFIGGLTDAVPVCSQDTAILTDGELTSLEKLQIAVSPKISQVNRRVTETTALNLCAFSDRLYLVYPLRSGGEECGVSEIISYARHLFTVDGNALAPVPCAPFCVTDENFPYVCARPTPALRYVNAYLSGDKDYGERRISAVYRHLCESGGISGLPVEQAVRDNGGQFALLYGQSVSPTALETYYSCPYKAFMQQGLRLSERREGAFRPLDSGNFIHAVLERVAERINGFTTADECREYAQSCALELLKKVEFAVDDDDRGAGYAAGELVKEAQSVALGAYEQLKNSRFTVEQCEARCKVNLSDGSAVGGRIDRVDSCGDMVRVIDYKTGSIDDSPASYYMGLKLQLPLYLSAASEGRRAAGAYYFPANLEYSSEGVGAFTLKGFMDGSEEVVRNSDVNLAEKERSAYVGAYLNGRKLDRAMTSEDFNLFIEYSKLLAERGAAQIKAGEIAPSPVKGACSRCSFFGCCGYDREKSGEREILSADCKTVADIVRGEKSGGDGQ